MHPVQQKQKPIFFEAIFSRDEEKIKEKRKRPQWPLSIFFNF